MAISSVRTFEATATTLAEGARALATAARTAIESRTDRRALSYARSTATGLRGDVRELRGDLDVTNVTTLVRYQRGEDIVALWQWERGMRSALVGIDDVLRRTEAVLDYALESTPAEVYVVRSGDTLQSIAAKLLGDWREWTRIAEVNGLEPGAVASGTVLRIPPRR